MMVKQPKKAWPGRNLYKGDLARPLQLSVTADDAERQELLREAERRFGLLIAHYRVDINLPGAWQRLAIELANNHVLGLQCEIVRQGGRATKKPGNYDSELLDARKLVEQKYGGEFWGLDSFLAKELAVRSVEHEAKAEGRNPSAAAKEKRIASLTRTIKNELSLAKKPPVK